jgi:minichromosome maintenance protein 10
MANAADDLDLLLSLGEAVPETPPASPRTADVPVCDGAFTPPRTAPPGGTDMSVFRDAVKDYLEAAPETTSPLANRPKRPKATEILVDKYSGLRIKHLTLSPLEISNRFADIRFVRITALK